MNEYHISMFNNRIPDFKLDLNQINNTFFILDLGEDMTIRFVIFLSLLSS